MKIFFLAGEVSGDHHASYVIQKIKQIHPTAQIRGFGGDQMQAAGTAILRDLSYLAFMGFYEVARNLPTIRQNFKIAKSEIQSWQPDLLVLVDYPGFNLRMAKWAKAKGIKVCYFIAPQVWAWKENRLHDLRAYVDLLIPILPFEVDYFQKHKVPVAYYGHPLLERIKTYQENNPPTTGKAIIALFPGSRKQEVTQILPVMLAIAKEKSQSRFVLGATSHLPPATYAQAETYTNVTILYDRTYDILQDAEIALTTSGTITLEAAILGVPQVVCYKTSKASYAVGKRLIKVSYISLVNLILDQMLVSELIQDQLTKQNLLSEIQKLENPDHRCQVIDGYEKLVHTLGANNNENISTRIAQGIIDLSSS